LWSCVFQKWVPLQQGRRCDERMSPGVAVRVGSLLAECRFGLPRARARRIHHTSRLR